MSAFDIAGAVVWTPLAALLFASWGYGVHKWDGVSTKPDGTVSLFTLTLICTALSAFCIARLFGAHL